MNYIINILGMLLWLFIALLILSPFIFLLVYLLLHHLYVKKIVKSKKFALNLSDLSRFRLLLQCSKYYKQKIQHQGSDEWLDMQFKCVTSSWLFPAREKIEVEYMLKTDYFYKAYFDLPEFTKARYLEMYDDFFTGKYKEQEAYKLYNFLKNKLPEGLRDEKTINELLLLHKAGWITADGQPIVTKKRPFQEIVLACFHIHEFEYAKLFGKLWKKSPESIKNNKLNALNGKNGAKYLEEISKILGRKVA